MLILTIQAAFLFRIKGFDGLLRIGFVARGRKGHRNHTGTPVGKTQKAYAGNAVGSAALQDGRMDM